MLMTRTRWLPPEAAHMRRRDWPGSAEYSVATHLFMLPPERADLRMLFLFSSSWGLSGNGTHLRLFWKDSKVEAGRDKYVDMPLRQPEVQRRGGEAQDCALCLTLGRSVHGWSVGPCCGAPL